MRLITAITLMLTSLSGFSQSWSHYIENDSFKGIRKIAKAEGINCQSAIKPVLLIRTSERDSMELSFLITDKGSDCSKRQIQVRFDGDKKVYTFRGDVAADRNTWILEYEYFEINGNLTITDLIANMESHSKMYIHLQSDCYNSDLEFGLSGAAEAIDFAASDFIKTIKRLQAQYNALTGE